MSVVPVEAEEICARGCVRTGRHLPGCECGTDGHTHHICASCDGCMPRGAAVGRLCQACDGRITRALLGAGELAEWVRENIEPGSGGDGPRVTGSREAPVPLSLTALDTADAVHAVLATWVARYCAHTGLRGPGLGGTDLRPRIILREDGHATVQLRPVGTRANQSVEEVGQATGRLAAWLAAHHEGLAHLETAPAWHDDVVTTIRRASSRFPRAEPARKLPIPCPSCDLLMLFMHPPAGPGFPTTVACHADECGRVLTEADYYLRAQTLLHERTGKAARA